MKSFFITFLLTVAVAAGLMANEYEVTIGDKTYVLKEGETKIIVTPKGERLPIVVRKKKILTFPDDALSFNYSSDMKLSTEMELGIKTITVECENSALFMAQILPYKIDPKNAVKDLIIEIRDELKRLGAIFPEKSTDYIEKKIGGVMRTGMKLRFLIGDLRTETEVFAFLKGNKTITLSFQADHEDREIATKYFKIIIDSLK
jgi:hypothetical protein